MKFLFDTNVIIAFLKNDKEIVEKIINYDISISATTAGELLYGIKIPREKPKI